MDNQHSTSGSLNLLSNFMKELPNLQLEISQKDEKIDELQSLIKELKQEKEESLKAAEKERKDKKKYKKRAEVFQEQLLEKAQLFSEKEAEVAKKIETLEKDNAFLNTEISSLYQSLLQQKRVIRDLQEKLNSSKPEVEVQLPDSPPRSSSTTATPFAFPVEKARVPEISTTTQPEAESSAPEPVKEKAEKQEKQPEVQNSEVIVTCDNALILTNRSGMRISFNTEEDEEIVKFIFDRPEVPELKVPFWDAAAEKVKTVRNVSRSGGTVRQRFTKYLAQTLHERKWLNTPTHRKIAKKCYGMAFGGAFSVESPREYLRMYDEERKVEVKVKKTSISSDSPSTALLSSTPIPSTSGSSALFPSSPIPSTSGQSSPFPSTPLRSASETSISVLSASDLSASAPSTSEPSTLSPSTFGLSAPDPSTSGPSVSDLSTPLPSASDLPTSEPSTSGLSTSGLSASEPSTSDPSASDPSTSGPSAFDQSASGPTTPSPPTSSPVTFELKPSAFISFKRLSKPPKVFRNPSRSHSRSPSKSPRRSRSRSKSPKRSKSSKRPRSYSRSRSRSRSKSRSRNRSRSPKRSKSRSELPKRYRSRSRSSSRFSSRSSSCSRGRSRSPKRYNTQYDDDWEEKPKETNKKFKFFKFNGYEDTVIFEYMFSSVEPAKDGKVPLRYWTDLSNRLQSVPPHVYRSVRSIFRRVKYALIKRIHLERLNKDWHRERAIFWYRYIYQNDQKSIKHFVKLYDHYRKKLPKTPIQETSQQQLPEVPENFPEFTEEEDELLMSFIFNPNNRPELASMSYWKAASEALKPVSKIDRDFRSVKHRFETHLSELIHKREACLTGGEVIYNIAMICYDFCFGHAPEKCEEFKRLYRWSNAVSKYSTPPQVVKQEKPEVVSESLNPPDISPAPP